MTPEDWNSYDSTICAKDRKKLMQNWFKMDQVYTRVGEAQEFLNCLGFQVAFDESGRIVGYGTIRAVNLNRLCGCPFYADSLEVAERLLVDILAEIPNFKEQFENLFFWHPETNKNVQTLVYRSLTSFYQHLFQTARQLFD